jgi:hypothetical protein
MELTSGLGAIKNELLDKLRGKPCRERIIDVDVYPGYCDCGWSARPIGYLSNDEQREFIAARFAVQRLFLFSPD